MTDVEDCDWIVDSTVCDMVKQVLTWEKYPWAAKWHGPSLVALIDDDLWLPASAQHELSIENRRHQLCNLNHSGFQFSRGNNYMAKIKWFARSCGFPLYRTQNFMDYHRVCIMGQLISDGSDLSQPGIRLHIWKQPMSVVLFCIHQSAKQPHMHVTADQTIGRDEVASSCWESDSISLQRTIA